MDSIFSSLQPHNLIYTHIYACVRACVKTYVCQILLGEVSVLLCLTLTAGVEPIIPVNHCLMRD